MQVAGSTWQVYGGALFIPFSAQTRLSGIDCDDSSIRKGAVGAVLDYVDATRAAGARHGNVQGNIQGNVAVAIRQDPAVREVQTIAEQIAKEGGTPLAVAKDGKLPGVIHLKDIVKGGIRGRFAALRKMGIRTVMITGDNPMTASAIAAEAGGRRFPGTGDPRAEAGIDPPATGPRQVGGDVR